MKEVDSVTFKYAMEQWEIYCAWEADFKRGLANLAAHPEKGDVSQRYDELKLLVERHIDSAPVVRKIKASFRAKAVGADQAKNGLCQFEVTWARH
ncbi:MAG: hypothetical protein AAGF53_13770 [Pseudomonadota bacterium]